MKLTAKQRLFCDEYIKSGNATDAAIKAGYSMKTAKQTGTENLSKPYLKAFINAKMKEIESHKIADAKEVLKYLTSVMRGEQTEDVVTNQGVFKDVPVSAKDRISAAKELIKRYPNADPIEQAKLQKLLADTRISEAKANIAERLGSEGDNKLDELMDKLINESEKSKQQT